jgi:hypothetical protein
MHVEVRVRWGCLLDARLRHRADLAVGRNTGIVGTAWLHRSRLAGRIYLRII